MADFSLTFEELYQKVSRFLGWGETPVDDQLKIVKDIVYRGYRQFLYPVDQRSGKDYCWSFLRKYYTIPVQTGKWKYALPENFSELLTDPGYDDNDRYASLTKITPEQLLDLRVVSVETNPMFFYSIVTAPYDLEVGTRYEMWFHGEPNSSYVIRMFYRIDPMKPEGTSDKLVGGIKSIEPIIETCLGVAELQEDGQGGAHYALGQKLTQDLIINDSGKDDDLIIGNLLTGDSGNVIKRGENMTFSLDNLYPGEQTYSE
jgi:hypothetical protein